MPIKSKVHKFNKKQHILLNKYRQEWLQVGLCTESVNQQQGEAAISELYQVMDLPSPRFVWVSSPMAAQIAINVLKKQLWFKKSLEIYWHALRYSSFSFALQLSIYKLQRAFIDKPLYNPGISPIVPWRKDFHQEDIFRRWNSAHSTNLLEDKLPEPLLNYLNDNLLYPLAGQLLEVREICESELFFNHEPIFNNWPVHPTASGSLTAHWIGLRTFVRDILGVKFSAKTSQQLDLWSAIARSVFWWWPFESIVIVSDRPCDIKLSFQQIGANPVQKVTFRDGWIACNT